MLRVSVALGVEGFGANLHGKCSRVVGFRVGLRLEHGVSGSFVVFLFCFSQT